LIGIAGNLLRLHHVPDPLDEWDLIQRALAFALLNSIQIWLFYLALEPYVRRRWPHTLISWKRLLAGRFRDAMVGRDLLVGIAGGMAVLILRLLTIHAPVLFGQAALRPTQEWLSPLTGTSNLVYAWLKLQGDALFTSMIVLLLLVLFLVVLRRRALAVTALWLISSLLINSRGDAPLFELSFGALMSGIIVVGLIRYGLLTLVTIVFIDAILYAAPITLDASAWYFGRSLSTLLAIAALSVYAFLLSLGDKPLLSLSALEE